MICYNENVQFNLSTKKCVPCEDGTPPLNSEQITNFNQQLTKSWEVIDNTKLKKDFNFENFKQAIEFVNKVAIIAEQEQHHPDISILYSKVVLKLWTHSIGGLSENDYIMAEKINNLS